MQKTMTVSVGWGRGLLVVLAIFLQMRKKFTLYAIYSLANQWGEPEQFDLKRLPLDIAEGVRIEDLSQLLRHDTFKFVEKRAGSDEVEVCKERDTPSFIALTQR